MTWRDKLELGLKDDAAFRKDNLPPDEVHGPEEVSGPGRSPVVTEVRDRHWPADKDGAARRPDKDDIAAAESAATGQEERARTGTVTPE